MSCSRTTAAIYRSIIHLGKPLGKGLYLRTHVGRGLKGSRELYYFEVVHDGDVIPYEETCSPSLLTLTTAYGQVDICLPGECGMRVRCGGVGIRLRAVPDAKSSTNHDLMAR